MPMIPPPSYRLSVVTADDLEHYEVQVETASDPGECVAAIQVLHPTWTEILIQRLEHPYQGK